MRMPRRVDAAIAAVVVVTGVLEITTDSVEGADPAPVLASLLVAAAALLVRSRMPLLCLAVLAPLVIVIELPAVGPALTASVAVALLVALGSVGRSCPDRTSIAAVAVAVGVLVVRAALGPAPSDAVVWLLGGGTAWAAGRLLRREAERNAELSALAAQLAAEQEMRAREAVGAERTRIARELHDAVAHTVSVMTLTAGGVRRRLDADPERVRERDVLLDVERLGREAVEELHRAVGVLRADPAGAPLAPPPRLVDVDELVARVRAAGLPVEVQVSGGPRPLPGGVELAAYRVVQEALTNVLKHAGATRACVEIGYDEARLTLAVVDDGRGAEGRPGGSGHGLDGMRERVALYGGHVAAGPRPDGGFAVRATLPLAGP